MGRRPGDRESGQTGFDVVAAIQRWTGGKVTAARENGSPTFTYGG